MYKIVKKRQLNAAVTFMSIHAPLVAKKAKAGQFIILRVDEAGERIPLTVAGYDELAGTVDIIFQIVGYTTAKLNEKNEGEFITDFVGPLGKATEIEGVKKVAIVGGGVGSAIAYPLAKAFYENGADVTSIIGFRTAELALLESEFKAVSTRLIKISDDGSWGAKGLVTEPLKKLLESGEKFDEIIAIGPVIMMKFVVETARPFKIKTLVSMNPIMIDGTGMCGGCRLTVNGKTVFACIDGPEFNGYEVNFDEAMSRNRSYFEHEHNMHCNLLKAANGGTNDANK